MPTLLPCFALFMVRRGGNISLLREYSQSVPKAPYDHVPGLRHRIPGELVCQASDVG